MKSLSARMITLLGIAALCAYMASAATMPIGFLAWDVNFPANAGEFDIVNLTGPNSVPPDFPVTSTVSLSSLNLVVDFGDGSTQTFGPGSGYFT